MKTNDPGSVSAFRDKPGIRLAQARSIFSREAAVLEDDPACRHPPCGLTLAVFVIFFWQNFNTVGGYAAVGMDVEVRNGFVRQMVQGGDIYKLT